MFGVIERDVLKNGAQYVHLASGTVNHSWGHELPHAVTSSQRKKLKCNKWKCKEYTIMRTG